MDDKLRAEIHIRTRLTIQNRSKKMTTTTRGKKRITEHLEEETKSTQRQITRFCLFIYLFDLIASSPKGRGIPFQPIKTMLLGGWGRSTL